MRGDVRPPLVIAASAVWDTPAPVNAHQIARRFAKRGHTVLFVESTGLRTPSLAAPHDLRRIAARLRGFAGGVRQVEERLHVLAPLALPGAGSTALRQLSAAALRFQVGRAVASLKLEAPVLWAFLPTALSLAAAFRHRALVYHCVDDYAGNPGVDAEWIGSLERQMLECADLVLASSPVLAERLAVHRDDVKLAANVADVDLFGRAVREDLPEPKELEGVPHPRLLYVGNLAGYRIDTALLQAARRAAPDGCLVLVGERGLGDTEAMSSELAALLADPAVVEAGPRPHPDLPAWMKHCDVALIPFLDNAHTRGSLPLKLYEYLAAGLPVVARALPNLSGKEALGVRTAADAGGFAAAIQEALGEPASRRQERHESAQAFGWDDRIEELARWIGEASG